MSREFTERIVEVEPFLIEVTCEHPDDSPRYYDFAMERGDWMCLDEEEAQHYYKEIRRQIEDYVNSCHYWHEVKITMVHHIDVKEYRKEI